MIAKIPRPLRWMLLVPLSIAAAFLVTRLVHLVSGSSGGALAYAAAFLSGLVYVGAALGVAQAVAPSHKKIVITLLGFFILGDLAMAHFVLPPSLIQEMEESPIGVILVALGVGDYENLRGGGLAKIAGALAGGLLTWRMVGWGERSRRDSLVVKL